jgi:iron-sulfur cluster repair protein YtfE (RIC family)
MHSPQNKYLQEYQNACKEAVDLNLKVKNNKTFSAEKQKNLAKELEYLKKQLPSIEKLVKEEEKKLAMLNKNKQGKGVGNKINYMA